MAKTFTAQHLFEMLRNLPEEERKHMKVVVSDNDDERCDVDDYIVCINRVNLRVKRPFSG